MTTQVKIVAFLFWNSRREWYEELGFLRTTSNASQHPLYKIARELYVLVFVCQCPVRNYLERTFETKLSD